MLLCFSDERCDEYVVTSLTFDTQRTALEKEKGGLSSSREVGEDLSSKKTSLAQRRLLRSLVAP